MLPIGAIAVSAPNVNNAIPTISNAPPSIKASSKLLGIGETVKHSNKTMAVIGSTEVKASLIFSLSFDLLSGICFSSDKFYIFYIISIFLDFANKIHSFLFKYYCEILLYNVY